MMRRVGEKETGTPLLKPISKMSLFRLLCSCLPIGLDSKLKLWYSVEIKPEIRKGSDKNYRTRIIDQPKYGAEIVNVFLFLINLFFIK